MPSKKQRRHQKRLAERRADEDRVHKQVVLDWLNKMAKDYPKMYPEGIIACFQEEFDFWPEQEDPNAFASLMRGPRSMARTDDPDTSKKAAFDAYPRTGSQRRTALVVIIGSGERGMTYAEVEQRTGIRGVWKRLSELRQGGWIKASDDTRLVAATGSSAQVYVATPKARDTYYGKAGTA